MKVFSSSLMALLVMAALFWGNCLSCPQVFQSLKQSGPSHGCCHHSKNDSQQCSTQSLRNFVRVDFSAQDAPAAVLAALAAALTAPGLPEWTTAPAPAVHAPPDLLSLHASFRI